MKRGFVNMIEWSDKYKTEIAIIDMQHEELFRLFNKLYDLYNNQFLIDKYDHIVSALEELKDYTIYHFKAEEEYMLYIRYEKFFEHKLKHNDFISKIESIDYNLIDDDQQSYLLDLLKFITNWIVNHVITTDKQLPVDNKLYK